MVTPPLVFLQSPDKEYLTFEELWHWLDLSAKTVRKLIKERRLPNGVARKGGRKRYWNRETAAVCKWIVDHKPYFAEHPGEDASDGPDNEPDE
jgi:hypothetical protein